MTYFKRSDGSRGNERKLLWWELLAGLGSGQLQPLKVGSIVFGCPRSLKFRLASKLVIIFPTHMCVCAPRESGAANNQ
jgi:hypothetical protein